MRHAPIPGPLVKQITSISSPKSFNENEERDSLLLLSSNASRKASSVKSKITFLWWLAVSRGRKPLPVGAQYVRRLLLKIVPSLVTMPTPILFADPSNPMAIVLFFFILFHIYYGAMRGSRCEKISKERKKNAKKEIRDF